MGKLSSIPKKDPFLVWLRTSLKNGTTASKCVPKTCHSHLCLETSLAPSFGDAQVRGLVGVMHCSQLFVENRGVRAHLRYSPKSEDLFVTENSGIHLNN